MKEELIKQIQEEKLIVIVRGVAREKLVPLGQALYKAGIHFLEVTYSADHTISDRVTAEDIALLHNEFKGRMHIGAGTVTNEEQVGLTKSAGGEFIISPDTNPAVIKMTAQLDLVSIPGAYTPTEIQTADRSGADFIKLFPTAGLSEGYIKAVKGPFSHLKFLGVGGINEKNIEQYQNYGLCGFGIGSNLVDKKLIADNAFAAITEKARCYIRAVQKD